ncbi:MAG: hypothetical protein AB1730_12865 [Myxococcota bacterium]|jgi:hypothetical protein
MRALALAACLVTATAHASRTERDPIFVEAQTWTLAPVQSTGWLLGGTARASVGLLGVSVSGYQQALTGPVGTPSRLGSLLASLTATVRLEKKVAFGGVLGVNTLFAAPDVSSIAPSMGFFSRFAVLPWLSFELEATIAPWPHMRTDGLGAVTLRWKALTASIGVRLVQLEPRRRLGLGRTDLITVGVHLGLGVEWSG